MTIVFIVLGFIPSFAWLIFFLKEDFHPEPKKMLGLVFVAGALATLGALYTEYAVRDYFASIQITQYSIISLFFYALIEEIFKFAVAYAVISRSQYLDEPVDAMIYMITSALGFALIENVAILANSSQLFQAFGLVTMRFVGATLLHALCSGLVGYFWAKSIIRNRNQKIGVLIIGGIIFAAVLHMIFNYLIIISNNIVIYPTIFLITISLLVFWDFEKLKGSKPEIIN